MAKANATQFAAFLRQRAVAKDGYIMGAIGQNPKKLSCWYFDQYKGNSTQHKQALYWKEHAQRVWDCQGMAEGYLNDTLKTSINVRARNNYSSWCSPNGTGKIPTKHRLPGAAVFIHNGSYISHVGFLVEPVVVNKPEGDWYVVEARGVTYGVVKTKLGSRGWNRWGLMTKYFDYGNPLATEAPVYEFGERELEKSCIGADVKALQQALIALGFSCGSYGADGEFGAITQSAVVAFQHHHGLTEDGIVGKETFAKLNVLLPDDADPVDPNASDAIAKVKVTRGKTVNIRSAPKTSARIMGIARLGDAYTFRSEMDGWYEIDLGGEPAWITKKYTDKE